MITKSKEWGLCTSACSGRRTRRRRAGCWVPGEVSSNSMRHSVTFHPLGWVVAYCGTSSATLCSSGRVGDGARMRMCCQSANSLANWRSQQGQTIHGALSCSLLFGSSTSRPIACARRMPARSNYAQDWSSHASSHPVSWYLTYPYLGWRPASSSCVGGVPCCVSSLAAMVTAATGPPPVTAPVLLALVSWGSGSPTSATGSHIFFHRVGVGCVRGHLVFMWPLKQRSQNTPCPQPQKMWPPRWSCFVSPL